MNLEVWSQLLQQVEDALAKGLTAVEARSATEAAISSLRADRAFALDEEGRDLYPHLAEEDDA